MAALGLALVITGALLPILSIIFIDYILIQGFEGLVAHIAWLYRSISLVTISAKLFAADNYDDFSDSSFDCSE